MVVLVDVPEKLERVASVMVGPFEQVRPNPYDKEAHDVIWPAVATRPAEGVGESI